MTVLRRLIRARLNVARLNFSHGEFSYHAEVISRIRAAAGEIGRRAAIVADLPGPKMRLCKIDPEPIQLLPGDHFSLTNQDIIGNARRVSMTFADLPRVVKPGIRLYLNDGLVNSPKIASHSLSCPRRRSAPLPNEVRQDMFDP